MATVDKNFKVKHGLVVEGTTATVNGEDIITTGSTTDSLPEGSTNVYYTEGRAKTDAAELLTGATLTNITITGDGDGLTITAENGVADSDTDDLAEGSTNLYFTAERAQDAVGNSVGQGLTYDDAAGAVKANINSFAGAIGTHSSGWLEVKVDGTSIDTSGSGNQLRVLTGEGSPVASKTYVSDTVGTHALDTSTHGVSGDIVGTTDAQTLTNKTMGDDLLMDGYQISGLGTPTQADHAATKSYVDAVSEGLHVHEAVRVAVDGNIAIATALENGDTAGGVTLVTGDRVLLKDQTTASENGIYVVQASGQALRAVDFDTATEVASGDFVFVSEGTYANTGWVQTLNPATIGTDPINFTQFSGAGTFLAGNGLTLDGNTFEIDETITATRTFASGEAATAESNANAYTDTGLGGKQDTLTAGNGIEITANTISANVDAMSITNSGGLGNQLALQTGPGLSVGSFGVTVNVDGSTLRNDLGSSYNILGVQYGSGLTENSTGLIVDTTVIADKSYVDTNFVNVADLPGQLDDYILLAEKGQPAGVATLDSVGNIPVEQLGNVPDAYITALGNTETNLAVSNGELALTSTPKFEAVNFGSSNFVKQVATLVSDTDPVTVTALSWPKADYRSAKLTVSTTTGGNTQVSELLIAIDDSDNVAITEYGMVYTSGELASITADISGNDVRLRVTLTGYGQPVTTTGTLIKY